MTELPSEINIEYLRNINPAAAAAANVAHTVNTLIHYLKEREHLLNQLTKTAKEVDTLEQQYKASSDS